MALYSGKIGVWGGFQTMWDLFHTDLCAKRFPYIVFWNPSCIRILGYAYALSMRTHGLNVRIHTCLCIRTLRVSNSLSFPNSMVCSLQSTRKCQDICQTCQKYMLCKLANPLTKHTLLIIRQIQDGFSTSRNKS